MGASISEVVRSLREALLTPKTFKVLVLASGILNIITLVIYLIVLLCPQVSFTGYVYGHISLTSYDLRYNTNNRFIRLPNLDVVYTVSLIVVVHTFLLLTITVLSLIILRGWPLASVSMVYGSSLSLLVSSGILRYLSQVFIVDAGRIMQYANKGPFRFKTLAGLIEYPGITAEKTIANALLFTYSWLIMLLLYISLAFSVAAVILAAWRYGGEASRQVKRGWQISIFRLLRKTSSCVQVLSSITLTTLLFYTGASVFTYLPSIASITPTSPPITLDYPPYIYTLERIGRTAIVYTDFETYPVSGWAADGGIWSSVGGIVGAKGNALRGSDNNRGLGDASQYYYNADLSRYLSQWIVVKTGFVSGAGYYGISMMRNPRNRMYTVEIHTGGRVYIRSYGVESPPGWAELASDTIPGYSVASWYIIVVNYTVTTTAVNIMASVYDFTGNLLVSTSASSTSVRRFTPAYIGVEVDDTTAHFDEFLTATSDPRNIYFSGLAAGMKVEVWDNLGNLVSSGTAAEATLSLSVVQDAVVGTGINGRIAVKYPDGSPCIVYDVPSTDAILGGDAYKLTSSISVTLGNNRTSAIISARVSAGPPATTIIFIRIANIDAKLYYVHLILSPQSSLDRLTANISLADGVSAKNITIVNGAVISDATSWITMQPGATVNAVLSAYFPSIGFAATLYILLEYSTLPGGQGACVYYPIELNLNAASISTSSSTTHLIEQDPYRAEEAPHVNDVVNVLHQENTTGN